MKPMTPDEEAAHRLGDQTHRRAFVEEAAIRIRAAYSGNDSCNIEAKRRPQVAASEACKLWEALQVEMRARGWE